MTFSTSLRCFCTSRCALLSPLSPSGYILATPGAKTILRACVQRLKYDTYAFSLACKCMHGRLYLRICVCVCSPLVKHLDNRTGPRPCPTSFARPDSTLPHKTTPPQKPGNHDRPLGSLPTPFPCPNTQHSVRDPVFRFSLRSILLNLLAIIEWKPPLLPAQNPDVCRSRRYICGSRV